MSVPPNETAIRTALQEVIDPELGCNIIDLGLVYSVEIAGAKVSIKMTLTTPGCPMHESMISGVQMALLGIEGVDDAEVELVWEPRWNPAMMTDIGRAHLGMA